MAGVPLVAAVLARLADREEQLTVARVGGLLVGFALPLGFHASTGGVFPTVKSSWARQDYAGGCVDY